MAEDEEDDEDLDDDDLELIEENTGIKQIRVCSNFFISLMALQIGETPQKVEAIQCN